MMADGIAMGDGRLKTTVTYLEMRPPFETDVPVVDAWLEHVTVPTLAFYRFLYDTVGEEWLWGDRRRMADADLAAIIGDIRVEVHVLYADGQPAGYLELDRRFPPDLEVGYLGVMAHAIGRGYGRFLIRAAIAKAYAYGAERLWLHTCDLDHPKALGFYKANGFVPYKEAIEVVPDPRALGLIREDAGAHIPFYCRS